jgi:hypothetical protein
LEVSLLTRDVMRNLNVLAIELSAEVPGLSGVVMVEGMSVTVRRRGNVWDEDVRLTGTLLPDARLT